MKKIKYISLALLLTLPLLSFAEEDEFFHTDIGGSNTEATGVDCFDHYHFGSIDIDLSLDKINYSEGETARLSGRLKNNNDYPVTEGGLHVQVFRKNENYERKAGSDLVEEFFALTDISINSNSSTAKSFEWQVPQGISSGEYFMAIDFVVDEKLNLSGAPILEGVHGAVNNFTVESGTDSAVYFDKNSVFVNGEQFLARDFIPTVEEGEDVVVDYSVLGGGGVEVTEKLYKWDNLSEENLIEENSYNVSSQRRSELGLLSPGTYLLEISKSDGAPAKMNVRFFVEGSPINGRINFQALENFPLQEGERGHIFVCFHSVGNVTTDDQEVVLEIKDENGNLIKEIRYDGPISSNMMAIREEFVADRSYDNLNLTGSIYDNGVLVDSSTTNYNPQKFGMISSLSVKVEDDELVVSSLDLFDNPVETEMAVEVQDSQGNTVFFEPSFSGSELRKILELDENEDYKVTVLSKNEGIKSVTDFTSSERADEERTLAFAILAVLLIIAIIVAILIVVKRRSKI